MSLRPLAVVAVLGLAGGAVVACGGDDHDRADELCDACRPNVDDDCRSECLRFCGDDESAEQDSFMEGLLDYPHYTRPEIVAGKRVPAVLLSGDHARIARWRYKQALGRSYLRRPELVKQLKLDHEQQKLLDEFLKEQGEL